MSSCMNFWLKKKRVKSLTRITFNNYWNKFQNRMLKCKGTKTYLGIKLTSLNRINNSNVSRFRVSLKLWCYKMNLNMQRLFVNLNGSTRPSILSFRLKSNKRNKHFNRLRVSLIERTERKICYWIIRVLWKRKSSTFLQRLVL